MADILPVAAHGDGGFFLPEESTPKTPPKLKKTTSFSVPDNDLGKADDQSSKDVNRKEPLQIKYKAIEDKSWRYGWLCWHPQCLQCFNNPKGYLLFFCTFVFAQGFAVNGMVYVILSTLERRFNLPSVKSGLISSTYDIAVMCVVGFVTFFGERGHKPLYLGAGALLFAIGSVTFTLPHFLSDLYRYETTELDFCEVNRTIPDTCNMGDGDNLRRYYSLFIIAQVLHGLGAAPIYTLGLTYIDENLPPKQAALYTGIFQATAVLGPAVGFLAGGMFLDIYTDFYLDIIDIGIAPDSPLWVGAWWLGFLVSGSMALFVAPIMVGFPKHLPEYHIAQLKRHRESRAGSEITLKVQSGAAKLFDLPVALLSLIKNPTYVFIVCAAVCETFIMAYISAFGPKFVESMFSVTSGNAALAIGLLVVPAGIIGNLLGGWVIRRFSLTIPGMLKVILTSITCGLIGMTMFILSCPNLPFAGVNIGYTNSTSGAGNLTALCNSNCNCADSYAPVCGSDSVIYYSSCHAGCTVELNPVNNGNKQYGNCSCIHRDDFEYVGGGTATEGLCRQDCVVMIPWFILLFLISIFTFFVTVPSLTCVLRCVDYSQRSFALGLQTLLTKVLGYVPGPIIFGALIDQACFFWDHACYNEGGKICWAYDNKRLAYTMLSLSVVLRALSICFYSAAWCTYKPAEVTGTTDTETAILIKKDNSDGDIEVSQSRYKSI